MQIFIEDYKVNIIQRQKIIYIYINYKTTNKYKFLQIKQKIIPTSNAFPKLNKRGYERYFDSHQYKIWYFRSEYLKLHELTSH